MLYACTCVLVPVLYTSLYTLQITLHSHNNPPIAPPTASLPFILYHILIYTSHLQCFSLNVVLPSLCCASVTSFAHRCIYSCLSSTPSLNVSNSVNLCLGVCRCRCVRRLVCMDAQSPHTITPITQPPRSHNHHDHTITTITQSPQSHRLSAHNHTTPLLHMGEDIHLFHLWISSGIT